MEPRFSDSTVRKVTPVGVAHYPADGATATDLMSRADARMYQHKGGRKSLPQ
jgi:GGDEF domain-containing protein